MAALWRGNAITKEGIRQSKKSCSQETLLVAVVFAAGHNLKGRNVELFYFGLRKSKVVTKTGRRACIFCNQGICKQETCCAGRFHCRSFWECKQQTECAVRQETLLVPDRIRLIILGRMNSHHKNNSHQIITMTNQSFFLAFFVLAAASPFLPSSAFFNTPNASNFAISDFELRLMELSRLKA